METENLTLEQNPEPPPQSVKDQVAAHVANGGTAYCMITVPVGAQVLILHDGELSGVEVGIGEILEKSTHDIFAAMEAAHGTA